MKNANPLILAVLSSVSVSISISACGGEESFEPWGTSVKGEDWSSQTNHTSCNQFFDSEIWYATNDDFGTPSNLTGSEEKVSIKFPYTDPASQMNNDPVRLRFVPPEIGLSYRIVILGTAAVAGPIKSMKLNCYAALDRSGVKTPLQQCPNWVESKTTDCCEAVVSGETLLRLGPDISWDTRSFVLDAINEYRLGDKVDLEIQVSLPSVTTYTDAYCQQFMLQRCDRMNTCEPSDWVR